MPIEGGSAHYKRGTVEPLELIEGQNLPFHLANVVKYAVRIHFYSHNDANYSPKEVYTAIDKAIWYLERYRTLIKQGEPK